jgi:hypothetical protein
VREETQKAKDAQKLERWVKRTADNFENAVLESAHWLGWWPASDPEDDAEIRSFLSLDDLDDIKTRLTAELRKARKGAQQVSNWHRRLLPHKPMQWGPATLQAVNTIVQAVQLALEQTPRGGTSLREPLNGTPGCYAWKQDFSEQTILSGKTRLPMLFGTV